MIIVYVYDYIYEYIVCANGDILFKRQLLLYYYICVNKYLCECEQQTFLSRECDTLSWAEWLINKINYYYYK